METYCTRLLHEGKPHTSDSATDSQGAEVTHMHSFALDFHFYGAHGGKKLETECNSGG